MRLLPSTICLVLLLMPVAVHGGIAVSVVANPYAIPADGKSHSQVLVTALDQTGAPVPDGTEVQLTTSFGDVTPVVFTSGGRAVGILSSSTCAQTASVTALVGGQSASVQVEFLPVDSEQESASVGAITMEGASLAYSVDADTVYGSGGVTVEYGGVTISAISAQVSQASSRIRAQGEISVRRGDKTLKGDAMTWDIHSKRIYVFSSSSTSGVKGYNAGKLDPISSKELPDTGQDLSPLKGVDGNSWIICHRLTLIPGKQILFFRASIYVQDTKVITLPYYAYSYDQRQSFLQQVRFTSTDGVLVDFPLYYRMDASGPGALKLRYAASGSDIGGYSRPRKGLSMGLEQGYSTGENSQGTVFIDSVGSPNQAYELAHRLAFGPIGSGGQARLSARYQPFSSYARGMYSTALNVAGALGDYNYSLSGCAGGSSIPRSDTSVDTSDVHESTCSLRTTVRPRAPVSVGLLGKVSPSFTLGYGSLWNSSNQTGSSRLYQTLGLNVNRSQPGRHGISAGFTGASAFTLAANGAAGASLTLSPTLRTSWIGGNASIGYSFNAQRGATDNAAPSARHLVSFNLGLSHAGRWTSNSLICYGLDSGRLNMSTRLNYYATKQWRFESSYDLYRYTYDLNSRSYTYGTSYLKAGIYRAIGAYEVGMAWSPDGRNYGTERNKHLWLEIGDRGL